MFIFLIIVELADQLIPLLNVLNVNMTQIHSISNFYFLLQVFHFTQLVSGACSVGMLKVENVAKAQFTNINLTQNSM